MKMKSLAVELTIKKSPKILDGLEFVYLDSYKAIDHIDEEIFEFIYPVKILTENLIIEGVREDKELLLDPIYIKHADGDCRLLFDHTVHGYNGEFGITASEVRENATITEFTCPQCNDHFFDLTLILIYELWNGEVQGDEELQATISDAFTSLVLDGVCRNCKWHGNICSFECA